jgi:hypothetical protein
VILDVFTVITEQWHIVLGILLFIALGQSLVTAALKNLSGNTLTDAEYFALGLAGWILPVALISLLWVLPGFTSTTLLTQLVVLLGSFLLIVILFCLTLRADTETDSKKTIIFLLGLVLISTLLRLIFVSRAILPSYFDSAQHYSTIKNLLQHGTSTMYYHRGFHMVTAFLVTVLQADIAKTMLILGQLVLAIMPVSVFFIVKRTTGSNGAGIFAIILSALGWYMPAHALNWGKYPALMSIALLPFVLSLAYWLTQKGAAFTPQKRRILYGILGLGVVVLTLLHSRTLVILAIVFLAWVIAVWRQRLSWINQALILGIVILVLALEVLFIQTQAILVPLLDPYLNKGIWITALVVLLSILALREYSEVAFVCVLSMGLLLGGLFVPIQIPGYGSLTLLDRPFVETILYLPLSILGGLGLAGLETWLRHSLFRIFLYRKYIYGLFIGLMLIHAFIRYSLYPSDCCVLVGEDDLAALAWMEDHLPREAHIGISVTELNVLQSEALEGYTGGDAGIWITPLIDRVTIPLLFSSDFGQEAIKDKLCESGVSHLYEGELGQSFDSARLHKHPEWYRVLLSMPKVKVYEVVGCR